MINLKNHKMQRGALALITVLGIYSASGQTTPKPSYPTAAYAWAGNAAELYTAVERANNSNANPYYIRFYGSGTIKLTKPINLTKKKKYVFWKPAGTGKMIIDGQYKTPFLAARNGSNAGGPYPETSYSANNVWGQSIDLFNVQIYKCRNYINRNSNDGRGVQKWPGGGAIAVANFTDLRLIDCSFLNNHAVWPNNRRGDEACSEIVSGGAVRIFGKGSLKAWNCFFQNCVGLTGGAIHSKQANPEFYNTGFNNNGAKGGIDALYSGSLDWNTEGGAFRVDGAGTKTIIVRDSYFNNNWTESLIPPGVDLSRARSFNSNRGKPAPKEGQNGIAFNIWNGSKIGNSNTPVLDMRRCNFSGNKRGHIGTIRINDVSNSNPVNIIGCNFWNNGSADNKDYRDNNQVLFPNGPINDKTRTVVWSNNGPAWQSFSGSKIHPGNIHRNWTPTGYVAK